jgi:hypothetical protein
MSSRLLILALIAIALAAVIVWYARSDRIEALPSTPYDAGFATLPTRPDPPTARSRLQRVTRDARDRFAEQMARATAARTGQHAGSATTPPPRPKAAHLSSDPTIKKFNDRALEELGGAQTYLSECFDLHRKELPPKLTVLTNVLITTDPDVGAVVSADALTDPEGKPLPAAFDDCIRDMLQTFTLPPLPPTDDSQFLLALQLSFRDDD